MLTETQEFMKFQEPFRLTEISEFQTYLQRALTHVEASNESAQDLYNRSCALEPKSSVLSMKKVKSNTSVESLRHSVDRKELFGWTKRH